MFEISVAKSQLYDTLVTAMKQRLASIERVALYARVSTKDGRQDVRNQLIDLREFAKRQGWRIVHEYIDNASAKAGNHRPAFDKLFLDASQRKFDLLLFWALDRFSREGMGKTIRHLEKLTNYSIAWRSYKEPHLDTTNEMVRDILLAVFSTMAKQEHQRISERTLAGLERARRAGKKLGRPWKNLTPAQIEKIHQMRDRNKSFTEIAQAMRVNRSTLYKHWCEIQDAA